ncbi:DNA N-6-adenine-methyltransferase [Neptunicella sp.]|uniref:DNA N-6-adenine-methyltransferase n=1 Tax=Neptunicella sp. TaxID=2125986 RepID=UPI003F69472E
MSLALAYKNTQNSDGDNDLAQTPWPIIKQLEIITGYNIAWDVCCQIQTAKAPRFYTGGQEDDALKLSWYHDMYGHFEEYENPPRNWAAYMNPPFSKMKEFTKKANEEALKGVVVIGCVKDAPDTGWYQEWVEETATVIIKPTTRIQFLKPDGSPFKRWDKKQKRWTKSGANFPVCFPVWTSIRHLQTPPIIRFTPEKGTK